MRVIVFGLMLGGGLCLHTTLASADSAADMAACTARQPELIKQTAEFKGDPQIKRLIEADLTRAKKEQAEGDGDECVEALDHAAKLLAGDI